MKHPGASKLHPGDDGIAILTPENCKGCHPDVKKLINDMGAMSSSVQGLNHTITTFSAFMSGENKIFMLVSEDQKEALGFVKIGYRHLFFWDHYGAQREFMNILCLLDFFVHPSTQRKGYGKKLIDKMLETEHKEMKDIPIDKPSPLCLSFMKKHFGLTQFTPQSNNYVIFEQFWEEQDKGRNDDDPYDPYSRRYPTIGSRNITPRLYTPKRTGAGNQMPIKQAPAQPIYQKARTPGRRLNPITWLPY